MSKLPIDVLRMAEGSRCAAVCLPPTRSHPAPIPAPAPPRLARTVLQMARRHLRHDPSLRLRLRCLLRGHALGAGVQCRAGRRGTRALHSAWKTRPDQPLLVLSVVPLCRRQFGWARQSADQRRALDRQRDERDARPAHLRVVAGHRGRRHRHRGQHELHGQLHPHNRDGPE